MSDELATEARSESEKRGITIGILVVALLCLALFFVWHHYGMTAESSAQPASAAPR